MRLLCLFVMGLVCVGSAVAHAATPVFVRVTDPYIELRTGAGEEFPIFYIAERDEQVQILLRRTDWFKVRTQREKEGWVSRLQMERTLTDAGVRATFRDALLEDYLRRRLYVAFGYGNFEYDPDITVRLGYQFSQNYAVELSRSEAVGTYSSTTLTQLNLIGSPVTDGRFVPFFTVGFGAYDNSPKPTLVNARARSATAGNAGVGAQYYMTRNFVARADFRHYAVPIDENRLGKYNQWSVGLSVFF